MADEPDDSFLKFNAGDVDNLMRFMDPNSDGDLSLPEVESAIRKLDRGELELKVLISHARVVRHKHTRLKILRHAHARSCTRTEGDRNFPETRCAFHQTKIEANGVFRSAGQGRGRRY